MFVAHDSPEYGRIFARDLLGAKDAIARRCGVNVAEFDALFAELLAAGVPGFDGEFVVSRRMVRDGKLRAVRAKAGRKGGKQRAKQKPSKPPSKSQANIKQNTEDEIEYDNDNESVIKEKEAPDDFELFWQAFPPGRKKSKGKARTAFAKAAAKAPAQELIMAAAEYAASAEGQGEFVKMPESWLNGECWHDDRESWKARGSAAARANHDPRGNLALRQRLLQGGQRHES
jgi:hypothetical protein